MTLKIRYAIIVGLIVTAGLATLRADVLSDLGVAASEATQMAVRGVLASGMPWGSAVQKFRAAGAPQRVAIVKNVMAWAKTFTASSAFTSAYAQARDHMKPAAPADALGMDDRVKQQLAELDKSEAEMKKQLANQPDMLKQVLANLEATRTQIQEMGKNPDVRKAVDAQNVQSKKDYEAKLAKFDTEHPADPHAAIAVRLHNFLDACRDVDFDAKLKPSGNRMVFVDNRYEQKSSEWKICFRAGREPVEAARSLAEAWLKEMGK